MLKSQVAKAYCSIGELYLTDLCYEDDAETRCEQAINNAVAADKDCLDGQQGIVHRISMSFELRIKLINNGSSLCEVVNYYGISLRFAMLKNISNFMPI